MKNVPIMAPATAADRVEIGTMLIMVYDVFLNALLYLTSHDAASKTMLAAVKPKKWMAPGLNVKLITVAISPTIVVDPSFLVHQTVSVNAAKPIRSQKKGRPNMVKKIGEKIEFNTPHKAAQNAIAATSLLLKYVTVYISIPVIQKSKIVILIYIVC
jgi:hypothetical protein